MGLDVESSGARAGLPLGFWFLLGFRVCDELVGGEYSTCVQVWSRGSCHFWGKGATGRQVWGPPLDPSTGLRMSGPAPGMDSSSGAGMTGKRVSVGGGGRDGLAGLGRPPLILREPQHERPHTGDGFQLGGWDGGGEGVVAQGDGGGEGCDTINTNAACAMGSNPSCTCLTGNIH